MKKSKELTTQVKMSQSWQRRDASAERYHSIRSKVILFTHHTHQGGKKMMKYDDGWVSNPCMLPDQHSFLLIVNEELWHTSDYFASMWWIKERNLLPKSRWTSDVRDERQLLSDFIPSSPSPLPTSHHTHQKREKRWSEWSVTSCLLSD